MPDQMTCRTARPRNANMNFESVLLSTNLTSSVKEQVVTTVSRSKGLKKLAPKSIENKHTNVHISHAKAISHWAS